MKEATGTKTTPAAVSGGRIQSIDIFRGLTILTMVFVNDVAGVSGIPAWMKHVPADADAMTFVDVVFPAFLFIVGMSIPFAVQNRLDRGQGWGEIWKHVAIRAAGLLVLGFFMVNGEEMNEEAMLIPGRIWTLLFYAGVLLIWAQYPRTEEAGRKRLFLILRLLGAALLIGLIPLFRKGETGQLSGMTHSWWGILGLIGWAYLYAMVVYWLSKGNKTVILGMVGLFTIMVVGLKSKGISVPEWLSFTSQEGNLAHGTSVLAGVFLSLLLRGENDGRIRNMLIFGGLLLVAGYFLRPLYGISKIHATPTWVLYCGAICSLIFPLVYWLVDVKGHSRWARFMEPAGKNPLLTYILPSIFYAIVSYSFWPQALSQGWAGVLRSMAFTLFILGVAAVLTRRRVMLQL